MSTQKFTEKAGQQLDQFSTSLARSNTSNAQLFNVPDDDQLEGDLDTFDGVFLPVFLSIWGVIVFLRLGFIIGQAGMIATLVMFVLGYLVTFFTSLSLSAIATNGVVRVGGPYYMISRCLGPEFGGSIGLIFFIGTVLSAIMSILGFVEPLQSLFGSNGSIGNFLPEGRYWNLLYTTSLLITSLYIAIVGGSLISASTRLLSFCLLFATISFLASIPTREPFQIPQRNVYFHGFNWDVLKANLWPRFGLDAGVQQNLQTVFSLVFPACTGILSGASMSAQLKSPSHSIPIGTLGAQLFTFTLYLLMIIFMSASIDRESLDKNFNIVQEITIIPHSINFGVLSSCFFSTLGSILGGANIFQAMAKDQILPGLHEISSFQSIIITYALLQIGLLLLSDMNQIAPYITMFSLLTFGVLNLATFALKISGSPNFRPAFKHYSSTSAFFGFLLSLVTMIIIDPSVASFSVLLVSIFFMFIHYYCPHKPWGDITQSLIYHQVRKFLLRLDSRKDHVKFWRPQILMMVNDPVESYKAITFVNDLKKGGLFLLGHVLKGAFDERVKDHNVYSSIWLRFVDITKIKAFVQLAIAPNERIGVQNMLLTSGLGGMKPNILVLGIFNTARSDTVGLDQEWSIQDDTLDELLFDPVMSSAPSKSQDDEEISAWNYVGIIEDTLAMDKAICITSGFENSHLPNRTKKTAVSKDILQSLSKGYRSSLSHWRKGYKLRVNVFVEFEQDAEAEFDKVTHLMNVLRIEAQLRKTWLNPIHGNGPSACYNQFKETGIKPSENIQEPREQLGKKLSIQSMTKINSERNSIFNRLDSNSQHTVMNQLIKSWSTDTKIILTTLVAPDKGTCKSPKLSLNYVEQLNSFVQGLPPSLLIHGKGQTVTTSL